MAYTLKFTDSVNKGSIIVEDGTINQETSLDIPGRNTTSFGTDIGENFLHLLENFADDTPPDRPVEGQLWYDTSAGESQLKIYDGTRWISAGGLKKATREPDVSSSLAGDLWADTDNQQLYLFTGSGWILVGPSFSEGLTTGSIPDTITDTGNKDHTVVRFDVDAQPVAIMATESFVPKTSILGFPKLEPGLNLADRDITGAGRTKLVGTAVKAENLEVGNSTVPASNFLRSDVVSTTDYSLRVKNNTGISIGSSLPLSIGIENGNAVLTHNTSGSSIDIRVNNSGNITTPLHLSSNTNVGINTTNPEESLDVNGNVQISDKLYVNSTVESSTFGSGSVQIKGGVGIAKRLNVGGETKISSKTTTADVVPDTEETTINRDLGSTNSRWNNVYANSFRGTLVGNVSGSISGRAGSADKLTSSTNFRMVGDVTAPEIVFDGQTGGNTKTFNTQISNSFISNKTSTSNTRVDDEFLLNRTSGAPGVYKVSRTNLFSAIPTNPPGIIVPYGGTTAPPGWLLCDGAEYEQSVYADLFDVIGFSFRDPLLLNGDSTIYFAVPDLRGRFPLGIDDMGTNRGAADRVTDPAADQIGNSSGTEDKDIRKQNLPEHEHDLRAPNGDQFYAIADIAPDASTDPTVIPFDAPTGTGAGTALANSGGIQGGGTDGNGSYREYPTDHNYQDEKLGSKLDVMNPYTAVNYIIYYGVTS